jgi:hypothetical protein
MALLAMLQVYKAWHPIVGRISELNQIAGVRGGAIQEHPPGQTRFPADYTPVQAATFITRTRDPVDMLV